jgi:two-component system chemotaxis response regulator CheY
VARVLIVDDSMTARLYLANILRAGGHQVVEQAVDGVDAIAKYTQHRPDVVTMDLHMPRLDGVEATARIIEQDPAAKIIVVTSEGQLAEVVRAVRAGAVGYLLKPFEPQRLVEAVNRASGPRKILALRPSAGPRHDLFQREAGQVLERLAAALDRIEAAPEGPLSAHLHEVHICISTLKGLAGLAGSQGIQTLCASAERLVARLRRSQRPLPLATLTQLFRQINAALLRPLAATEQEQADQEAIALARQIDAWLDGRRSPGKAEGGGRPTEDR